MKFLDTLFCDDIRFELNNKLSLMGLYTDRIIFSSNSDEIKWPLASKLVALLRFQLEQKDKIPNKFEFEYFLNEKNIMKVSGEIQSKDFHSMVNLIINADGIGLEPGNLGFQITIYADDDKLFSKTEKHALKISAS